MITSNINEVIGRLRTFRQAIPLAVRAALRPARWQEGARQTAQATLTALATADEARHVKAFIQTVQSTLLSEGEMGFVLSMRSPEARALFATQEGLPGFGAPVETSLHGLSQVAFENLLIDFVQTPVGEGGKRRDGRDAGRTDEGIAEGLARILLHPDPTPAMLAARQALMPHIIEFYQLWSAEFGLSPERAAEWLRAVLATWREMVRAQLPEIVRAEIRARRAA